MLPLGRHILAVLVGVSVALGQSQETVGTAPFDYQCSYSERDSGFLASSLDEDSVALLVIFATGGNVCEAHFSPNRLIPAWADSLFAVNGANSITRFYDDNSLGALHVQGVIANHTNNDSCYYSRYFPCWPGNADCFCAECPQLCDTCAYPSGCELLAFYKEAMTRADSSVDFSQFDRTGPNGQPDGVVDAMLFLIYWSSGWYSMGFGGLIDTFHTNDGVVIDWSTVGATVWIGPSYYESYGLIAHELGHALAHAHDWYSRDGLDHLALGGYDVMSSGGFTDGQSVYRPSLFNPYSRGQETRWSQVDTVRNTRFDAPLQPFADGQISYSVQGKAYQLGISADTMQYFLVTAHTLRSPWEQYWPNRGLLVWRVNRHAPYDTTWTHSRYWRALRSLEIESASGNWVWDSVGVFDGRTVAIRENIQDPTAGYDSLDFKFTRRNGVTDTMFSTSAGFNGNGYGSQFFVPGSSFDDRTNPPARLRVNQVPHFPRLVNPAVAVRNIRQVGDSSYVADLIVNAWQGTMTQSHTWFDSIYVGGDLTVASGATLTIDTGTVVVMHGNLTVASGGTMSVGAGVLFSMADSITITINGTLSALGNVVDSIRFQAASGLPQWGGIRVFSGGYANVRYAVIRDAFLPFWANGAGTSTVAMMLRDTRIIGGGNGLRIWGSPTRAHLAQRVTIQDVPNVNTYAALYFLNTNVQCQDMTVINSGYRTGYINTTTGYFSRCYFNGPTASYGLAISGATSGLVFKCCNLDHIAPAGYPSASVWCLSQGNPVFGASGNPLNNNRIVDDQSYLALFSGLAGKPGRTTCATSTGVV